ncbi:TetR/AcrR family transcriptional regulator [Ignatzschineria sp. LJL83]
MSRHKEILHLTSRYIRSYGYSNFSYADLAKEIGITKASLHYHFPTKENLVITLCQSIQESWEKKLHEIISENSQRSHLDQMSLFITANTDSLECNQTCALVALLNNYETLPEDLKKQVTELSQYEYALYLSFIQKAIQAKELKSSLNADLCVVELISLIKGSLIYKRLYSDIGEKFNCVDLILQNLLRTWRNQ